MYIRVGTGHNMAWGDCHYYVYQKRKSRYHDIIDEREDAIKDAIERHKENNIYEFTYKGKLPEKIDGIPLSCDTDKTIPMQIFSISGLFISKSCNFCLKPSINFSLLFRCPLTRATFF